MSEAQGDSKPTKAPEVVASNPERKSEKLQSPKVPRKIGFRKQIAGRIVGAAMALSAIGIPADNLNQNSNFSSINNNSEAINNNPEAIQTLSVQDLERRAESLYRIKIVGQFIKYPHKISYFLLIPFSRLNYCSITKFYCFLFFWGHNLYLI